MRLSQQVVWDESPILGQIRTKLMDWLIEYEGAEVPDIRAGLLNIVSEFPIHAFDARLILAGLAEDVIHIADVEQMTVWQGVGRDRVLDLVNELASTFRLEWFADGGSCTRNCPGEISEQLLEQAFWSFSHYEGCVLLDYCADMSGAAPSGAGAET